MRIPVRRRPCPAALALGALLFPVTLSHAQTIEDASDDPSVVAQQAGSDGQATNKAAQPTGQATPFYGLTVERVAGRDAPRVVSVVPDSEPWKAGLREGDYLVAFGEVRDRSYDAFLLGVEMVSQETYDDDTIDLVYDRDGEKIESEMKGIGRPPKEMRELEDRSQERIAERREENEQTDQAASDASVTTEQLERYLQLMQQSMSTGALGEEEQRELDRLQPALVGGGYLGGVGYGGYGGYGGVNAGVGGGGGTRPAGASSPGGGADRVAAGTFNDGRPTGPTDQTDPSVNPNAPNTPLTRRLDRELDRLAGRQQSGRLSPADSRRFEALRGLNRLTQSSRNGLGQAGFSPGMQREFGSLSRAARSGQISNQQQQRLRQMQSLRQRAAGSPTANRNSPYGTQRPNANRNAPLGGQTPTTNRNSPRGRTPASGNAGAGQSPIGAGSGIGTSGGGAAAGSGGAAGAGGAGAAAGSGN